MDNTLFESLLYEEESETLDFKRDQYPFPNSSIKEKSELLKDILAFINAWRRTDAYILIGIDEVRGARNKVVGIQEHLLNRNLQQFVNSKTNRPVQFSYRPFTFEGTEVGILHIPRQDRPVYLLKNFGKLETNKVYIRRSDTTDIAKPDEIARMGAPVQSEGGIQPDLNLEFADIKSRLLLGISLIRESEVLIIPELQSIPLYGEDNPTVFGLKTSFIDYTNRNYLRDIVKYLEKIKPLNALGFRVKNIATVLAENVFLSARIREQSKLVVIDDEDYPITPSESIPFIPASVQSSETGEICVQKHHDHWSIEANLGNIQPGNEVWSSNYFHIGAYESQIVNIEAQMAANNLSEPLSTKLVINFEASTRNFELEDIEWFLRQSDYEE